MKPRQPEHARRLGAELSKYGKSIRLTKWAAEALKLSRVFPAFNEVGDSLCGGKISRVIYDDLKVERTTESFQYRSPLQGIGCFLPPLHPLGYTTLQPCRLYVTPVPLPALTKEGIIQTTRPHIHPRTAPQMAPWNQLPSVRAKAKVQHCCTSPPTACGPGLVSSPHLPTSVLGECQK